METGSNEQGNYAQTKGLSRNNNFKHINKLKTKNMVPAINQNEGYISIIITQPKEVIDYDTAK